MVAQPRESEPSAPSAPSGESGRRARQSRRGTVLALGVLAIAWTLAIAQRAALGTDLALDLTLLHVLGLLATAGLVGILQLRGDDVTFGLLGLLCAVTLGPLGLLGAAILAAFDRTTGAESPLVTDWYERLSLAANVPADERLSEDVAAGRGIGLEGPPPASFPAAMASDDIDTRQSVLGHIARRFHPMHLAALRTALRSSEPIIRVQAAAVAAHVGPQIRARLVAAMAAAETGAGDAASALAALDELQTLLGSGFVDETSRAAAAAATERLSRRVLEAVDRRSLTLPHRSDPALAVVLDDRLEAILLAHRRFADLRAHRAARRIRCRHPGARLRRLARARRPLEAAE